MVDGARGLHGVPVLNLAVLASEEGQESVTILGHGTEADPVLAADTKQDTAIDRRVQVRKDGLGTILN